MSTAAVASYATLKACAISTGIKCSSVAFSGVGVGAAIVIASAWKMKKNIDMADDFDKDMDDLNAQLDALPEKRDAEAGSY